MTCRPLRENRWRAFPSSKWSGNEVKDDQIASDGILLEKEILELSLQKRESLFRKNHGTTKAEGQTVKKTAKEVMKHNGETLSAGGRRNECHTMGDPEKVKKTRRRSAERGGAGGNRVNSLTLPLLRIKAMENVKGR